MSSDNKGISVLFTYRHIFRFLLLLFCYFRHYWKAGTGPCAHPHANAESLTPAWWMSLAGGGSANQGLDDGEGFLMRSVPWWQETRDSIIASILDTWERCLSSGQKEWPHQEPDLDISASRRCEIDFCCSATLSVRVCVAAGRQI